MDNSQSFLGRLMGLGGVGVLILLAGLWVMQLRNAGNEPVIAGEGIVSSRTPKPEETATPFVPSPVPTEAMPTPALLPEGKFLWLDDCNPRESENFCGHYPSLDILQGFHSLFTSLNWQLVYDTPTTLDELGTYDAVIANFCSAAGNHLDLLRLYLANGGSVIAMGDESCLGTPPDGLSSRSVANDLTRDWGIEFIHTSDLQGSEPVVSMDIADHPATQGVERIYARRYPALGLSEGAFPLVTVNDKIFIAAVDGAGTLVAIPSIGFHWYLFDQLHDNNIFWSNTLWWLKVQKASKFQSNPAQQVTPLPTATPRTDVTFVPPTRTPFISTPVFLTPPPYLPPTQTPMGETRPTHTPVVPTTTPYVPAITPTPYLPPTITPLATPTSWTTPPPPPANQQAYARVIAASPSGGLITGGTYNFTLEYHFDESLHVPQAIILLDLVPAEAEPDAIAYGVFTPHPGHELFIVPENLEGVVLIHTETMPALGGQSWEGTMSLALRVRMVDANSWETLYEQIDPTWLYEMEDWAN